jgi:predicted DNA-binding transcriptional regulator YafY
MNNIKEKKQQTRSEKEYTGRIRSLRILFTIVSSPYTYTTKRLADKYEVDETTIQRDIKAFETAGFEVVQDDRFRYGLSADKKYDNLRSLLVFSPREEEILTQMLQELAKKGFSVEKLQNKLARIYDVSKMHNTFDKNFLTKMDILEKAKSDKKVVHLKDYPSTNSNTVSTRTVEAFHISAEEDIVHAFDLDKKAIRHFRISRITRVELTPQLWAFENHHNIVATDPFRIQDNNQVKVHLRLKVGARNELLERFPLTRSHLKEAPEGDEGLYDLECRVNHQFLGISNFVLGYQNDIVAIFEPEGLIDLIQAEAKRILEKKF